VRAGLRAGKLRILIATDQYEPMIGGVPTVTRELARGLAERGHAVEVLAPSASGRSGTGTGDVTVAARRSTASRPTSCTCTRR
jgi:glycogen synthase